MTPSGYLSTLTAKPQASSSTPHCGFQACEAWILHHEQRHCWHPDAKDGQLCALPDMSATTFGLRRGQEGEKARGLYLRWILKPEQAGNLQRIHSTMVFCALTVLVLLWVLVVFGIGSLDISKEAPITLVRSAPLSPVHSPGKPGGRSHHQDSKQIPMPSRLATDASGWFLLDP